MNAPTSAAAAEKPGSVSLAVQSEIRDSVEKEKVVSQHSKIHVHIETDAERIRSTLVRMTSNSIHELEGLVSELQEVREFLKSEGERVERTFMNYAQLNQSALAAIKIISETVGPWKSTALDSDAQNSGAGPLLGGHDMEKRTLKLGASK